MSETKTLAAKMAAVMGDVATMTKDGNNAAQKYQYTTAEQVKAAIRPLLARHGIALYATILDVTRETAPTKSGGSVVMTLAKMCITLACTETGEKMECLWYGEANDYADKGVNKAATAGLKYFLTNTFLLSTTEPESDEETIETPVEGVPADMKRAINAAGRDVYGQSWSAAARTLIQEITDGRGDTYAVMSAREGGELLGRLQLMKQERQTATA